ncbi:MAG: DUF6175 family protein [Chitinophagales bacterium]|nr:DUF6175 family protein [Chitinophagales bacterium]
MYKRILRLWSVLVFLALHSVNSSAQTIPEKEINRTQFTLMVVPFSERGEDVRNKIEKDFNYRVAINTISKAFEDRGYTTHSFIEALLILTTDQVANSQNQTDVFKAIQENSPSDVFVYADLTIQKGTNGTKVSLLLNARDKYSGETLASTDLLQSNQMFTEDYGKLTQQALIKDGAIENFLNRLNVKLKDISDNGRSVSVKIEVTASSDLVLDEEIGADYETLADVITDYVKKTAFKNYYHIKGQTGKILEFDIVKIPIKDTAGNNYLPQDYMRDFKKFLRGLSSKVSTGELKLEQGGILRGSRIQFNIL